MFPAGWIQYGFVVKRENMSDLASKLAIEIRQMILNGKFSPGDRMAEIPLAEKLGFSRTPTRAALSMLEKDGILVGFPTGGYTVRSFSLAEIREAIDVRGTLEGLAAEVLAMRGISRPALRELKDCVDRADELLTAKSFSEEQFDVFVELNARFHELILEEAGSRPLKRALESSEAYPFSAARMAVFDAQDAADNYRRLVVAQSQHHAIVEAIEAGEAGRAFALMREHSNLAKQALTVIMNRRDQIPGAHLVTSTGGV
jgi:GntR family transcriptional regulator, vanillate catabolism transcriptional regulator